MIAQLFSKRLDDSNGSIKDSSNKFMEQNETGTQNPAKPSNSTAGLLARVVKGVVSFLQNLLSPLTRKEGVRCGQEVFRLRTLSQTTAIGTLYGLLFAGLLLAPFPPQTVQAATCNCSTVYELPILLYPRTDFKNTPINICEHDWPSFWQGFHEIDSKYDRKIRELRIDWENCKDDADENALICLGICGLGGLAGTKPVRDLIKEIRANNEVPDWAIPIFPKPRIGNPIRTGITACALVCTGKWYLERHQCNKTFVRGVDKADREANDELRDLIDRWNRPASPEQTVQCITDWDGCLPEGLQEATGYYCN